MRKKYPYYKRRVKIGITQTTSHGRFCKTLIDGTHFQRDSESRSIATVIIHVNLKVIISKTHLNVNG